MEIFDRCSFWHIFSGALFGYLAALVVEGYWPLLVNGILAIAWEVVELSNAYINFLNLLGPRINDIVSGKSEHPPTGDTLVQIISDIVLHMAATVAVVATYVEVSNEAALVVMGSIMGASAFLYATMVIFNWLPVENHTTRCCAKREQMVV